MLDIGEYVVSRVNKDIPGETIIEALREMYMRTQDLSFEELDDENLTFLNNQFIITFMWLIHRT